MKRKVKDIKTGDTIILYNHFCEVLDCDGNFVLIENPIVGHAQGINCSPEDEFEISNDPTTDQFDNTKCNKIADLIDGVYVAHETYEKTVLDINFKYNANRGRHKHDPNKDVLVHLEPINFLSFDIDYLEKLATRYLDMSEKLRDKHKQILFGQSYGHDD